MGFELTTSGSWLQCSDNWAKSTFSCQPESSWPFKVMLYWFKKWTKSNMWSGAWNNAHFRNLLPNRFLPSSVVRALESWSGGCEFKPHWGQFLMKLILFCVTLDLSDNLTETPNVKNSNTRENTQHSQQWYHCSFTLEDLVRMHFKLSTRGQGCKQSQCKHSGGNHSRRKWKAWVEF